MAEPPLEELLRWVFKIADELEAEKPMTLDWPDDIDGQASCIRHLAFIANNPGMPYEHRVWAFDTLAGIARNYRESGRQESAPLEMFSWCFGVVSGAFVRPKRPGGRPPSSHTRKGLITAYVAWLVGRGETRTRAVEMVADAANLSVKRVDSILGETSFAEAKAKYSPEVLTRLLRTLENRDDC